MKAFTLCIIFLFPGIAVYSQLPFGTPLREGSVTLLIEETRERYCQGILSEKSEVKRSYSTQLTGVVRLDENEINLIRSWKTRGEIPGGMIGSKAAMDNHTQTLPDGMDFSDKGNYVVPLFPIHGKYEEKGYGKDPCKGWLNGCDPEYKAVLNLKKNGEGLYAHHGHPGGFFSASVVGVQNCSRYLFLSFHAGGTYAENGTVETCFIHGSTSALISEGLYNDCKWKWEEHESKQGLNVTIFDQSIQVSSSAKDDGSWTGSDGLYRRVEKTDEGDGEITTIQEEMMLMRVDTGAFFRYVIQKPVVQTFTATGYHNTTSDDGTTKTVYNVRYSASVTLGRKPPFTLAAENEEEYKSWLPGHPDYEGTDKPVTIKAKFEEGKEKDSIRFEIFNGSHLPGISTNYPILPENPPKEPIDIYFAPQEKQTDQNITVLNDSTVVTNKLVAEADVVVLSRDFGAHGRIRAMAMRSGEMAECAGDKTESISVPYDLNGNLIADQWEKDMGMEGAEKLEDRDNLPQGHGREGDGLTVFEEYRGFISEGDVEAACDGGHTLRTGKHVRTSPLTRDVFIHDPDGLFTKYVAPYNPAECHWHYVTSEQIRLPPKDEVSKVIKAYENNYPKAADVSEAANNIRTELDAAIQMAKNWDKKECRRINANSTDKFRTNLQFGVYLLTSPHASTEGGVTICPDPKSAQSPVRYSHLVVLPQPEISKRRMLEAISSLIAHTKHAELKSFYTPDVQDKVVRIAFETMVPHEVGHALGIDHHSKGRMTVISADTKEEFSIGAEYNGSRLDDSERQFKELYYKDNKEYLVTKVNYAFLALGVTECCMRYTIEREVDFLEKKVLIPSLKYCRKGEKFINGNGQPTDAEDCFSQIRIKCTE